MATIVIYIYLVLTTMNVSFLSKYLMYSISVSFCKSGSLWVIHLKFSPDGGYFMGLVCVVVVYF